MKSASFSHNYQQWQSHWVNCLFSAMAITLGNLYHEDVDVDVEQVAGVLAAACILQFKALIKG